MNEKTNEKLQYICSSIVAVIIGLLIGGVIMLLMVTFNPGMDFQDLWDGIRIMALGIFSKGRDAAGNLVFGFNGTHMGNMLFKATPLIMTGLSCVVASKAGLFNIGAPGQYLIGLMVSWIVALSIPSSVIPSFCIGLIALIAGATAAFLWAAVTGVLKAYLNVNEVIANILTNWIAANLVTKVFEGSVYINNIDSGKTGFLLPTSTNDVAFARTIISAIFPDSQVNGGIIFAVIIAIITFLVINKSVFGYEMRMCGSNRNAAQYCGINDKLNVILSMAIAGALAGIGGALYALAGNTEFFWSTYQSLPAVGFNGIPVSLLACLNPLAVIFTSMFMSSLEISGQQIAILTPFNEYIANLIIAMIVYMAALTATIKNVLIKIAKRGGKKA